MEWVITDNIQQETWRRILEFSNLELSFDEIVRRHGEPNKSNRQNYNKQAKQIRASVLQAKEYFDAAHYSSVYTSANHAYYGMVSLASAIMLLRGTGDKSLDILRADSKNNHHGLNFRTDVTASQAVNGLTLLDKSMCEILNHGHFINWYSTLPTKENTYAVVTKVLENATVTDWEIVGHSDLASPENLFGRKKSLMDLLKYIPDLITDLNRYGVSISSSRTTHKVTHTRAGELIHTWLIHGASNPDCLTEILSQFKMDPLTKNSTELFIADGRTNGIMNLIIRPGEKISFEWPNSRETIFNATISYGNVIDTMEIVDLYLIAYQLSMLSRYYPDVWISCHESQCKAAKLIERTVDILCKKAPILALSQLVPSGITISQHRESWSI